MTAPWNTDAPIEPYLRRARAAGIDRTVVFAPFHSDYAAANAEVARIVARYPRRLIGFAFVHPRRDAGRIFDMVQRAVTGYGFRGIKVHGYDALPTREVCETARAFSLPLIGGCDRSGVCRGDAGLAVSFGQLHHRPPGEFP